MKKIFLFFAALFTAIAMNAQTQQLYLKISSDWKYPSKYAIYYFNNTTNGWSDFMTEVDDEIDIYTATIPDGYTTVIFARFNSTKESTGNWDDKWSQTVNLTIEDGNNFFTITSGGTGDECNGTWSTFAATPWVDGSNSKLKVFKDGDTPGIVNVQKPGWAAESGIYATFPSAAWGDISLPASKYATEGAGMIIYLSALDLKYNEITVNCSSTDYPFTVYNVDGDEVVYNVAGNSIATFGSSWNTYDNKMTLNAGAYEWEKTDIELAAGDIEFKVYKNHSMNTGWPAENKVLNIASSGIYTISITFNESTKEITATATKTGEAVVLPPVDVNGSWAWDNPIDMTPALDKKSCSATYNFTATGTYEFGLHVNDAWKSNGNTCTFSRANDSVKLTGYSGNMNLDVDVVGEYTFTWYYDSSALKVTYPALPIKYCEFPTGHQKDPDFGDASARILLTLRKSGNNIVVTIKNNNDNGNPQTGLNFLWVSASGATTVTYGSHETANTETVSVTVEFSEPKDTYVFNNIHWAYAGFGGEWAIDGLTVKASELCQLENGYYLVGNFNKTAAWSLADLNADKLFSLNPENDAEYMLADVTLTAEDSLKVVKVVNDAYAAWYPQDDPNYIVDANHAGTKTIYFRPDGQGGEGWHYGYIFVNENEPSALDETNAEHKAIKRIINGQLLIEKNGKFYNALGTEMK